VLGWANINVKYVLEVESDCFIMSQCAMLQCNNVAWILSLVIFITKTVLDLNVLLKLFWIWFGLDMVWFGWWSGRLIRKYNTNVHFRLQMVCILLRLWDQCRLAFILVHCECSSWILWMSVCISQWCVSILNFRSQSFVKCLLVVICESHIFDWSYKPLD